MPQRRAITGRSQEPRARFAEELRLLRHARGASLRGVAEVVGWDASQFGKMENGHTLGGPEIVEALDQYYGTGGMLLTLWELAVADPTQFREQYRRYMTLEAEAISLWHYAVSTPPGLLQAPGYAREALAGGWLKGSELEQQVEARLGRRQLLEGEAPPPFRAILSEAVLRTWLRDMGAWREQLTHLAEMAERANITLQVLPFSAGRHGLTNTTVMFLRLPSGRVVAYTENDLRGELVEENASVELLQRRYDAMRDLALSPAESCDFILRTLEEAPCEPSI
ncbi:helix-turn-helix domain-containing protein [Streptomyces olivaceus]|uniref:helix-turn-helix domain-containing protein n=1 Tax=Streptomyces TaxID=1883 RepID=UPI00240D67C0|nr:MULTISPECIES: helix-turn-helix transcriptional regulator [Streptomyces]WFB88990.1 helix-turn-helix domain-containing protein [Streptomyces olivaceus]WGK51159.1 helix-turn-helix domain-containing protein [Streptomyces sp. B146]